MYWNPPDLKPSTPKHSYLETHTLFTSSHIHNLVSTAFAPSIYPLHYSYCFSTSRINVALLTQRQKQSNLSSLTNKSKLRLKSTFSPRHPKHHVPSTAHLTSPASIATCVTTVLYCPSHQRNFCYATMDIPSGLSPPPNTMDHKDSTSNEDESPTHTTITNSTYKEIETHSLCTVVTNHSILPQNLDPTIDYPSDTDEHPRTLRLRSSTTRTITSPAKHGPQEIDTPFFRTIVNSPTPDHESIPNLIGVHKQIRSVYNTLLSSRVTDALYQPLLPLSEPVITEHLTLIKNGTVFTYTREDVLNHILISVESFLTLLPLLDKLPQRKALRLSLPSMFIDCLLRWDPFRSQDEQNISRLLMHHLDMHHATLSREVNSELGSHYCDEPLPNTSDNICKCPFAYLDFRNVPKEQPNAVIAESQARLQLVEAFTTSHSLIAPLTAAKYFHSFEYRLSQLLRRAIRFNTDEIVIDHNPTPFVLLRNGNMRSSRIPNIWSKL
jgi:hypothetical protein